MEANLMVQAVAAPTSLDTRRPSPAETVRPERTSVDRIPAPSTRQAPAISPVDSVAIRPNVDILSAHPTVNPGTTEDLITLDIPMPFGDAEITESVVARYINTVNEALAPSFFRLNFGVHEPTNRIMVQVIDTNTDEILREIPPESRLDVIARMHEFVGLLFDERS